MPIYDYQCNDCGKTYDIFHKVREIAEDVVCPSCGSAQHTRLLSAPGFSMGGRTVPVAPACCGGSCGLN
ncbi:MAG: zinc ribbon domain-containing protein [Bacteroidetes bacterium]|nr:zinc ribbon domain-containing protein [Bacteroidota bacterium]